MMQTDSNAKMRAGDTLAKVETEWKLMYSPTREREREKEEERESEREKKKERVLLSSS